MIASGSRRCTDNDVTRERLQNRGRLETGDQMWNIQPDEWYSMKLPELFRYTPSRDSVPGFKWNFYDERTILNFSPWTIPILPISCYLERRNERCNIAIPKRIKIPLVLATIVFGTVAAVKSSRPLSRIACV